ncbi:MAG: hypothetical protein IT385_11860 [Deltaproteobacteria bacterium]|nr:hypothetical protein [Deltaproteobacteria bacterium]
MYGWLDVSGAGTPAFAHAQCGLCATYGRDYRTRTRMLAATDPSVLAVLVEALHDEAPPRARVRCPLTLMTVKRRAADPTWAPLEAVAALQVVLANEKLLDDRLDRDRAFARAAGRLFARDLATAEALLVGRGFPLDALRQALRRQAALEAAADSDLDALSAPTGDGLGLIVGWLAPADAHTREAAATFGRRLGRLLYMVDALQDLPRDRARGTFNPLTRLLATPSPARLRYVRDKVAGLIASLVDAFEALPLKRHTLPLRLATVEALSRRAQEVLP